jgi:hypothetical protein
VTTEKREFRIPPCNIDKSLVAGSAKKLRVFAETLTRIALLSIILARLVKASLNVQHDLQKMRKR